MEQYFTITFPKHYRLLYCTRDTKILLERFSLDHFKFLTCTKVENINAAAGTSLALAG